MMNPQNITVLAALQVCIVMTTGSYSSADEDLSIVSWNAESGDADSDEIAALMKRAGFNGVDIWGICDVQNQNWADTFELAAEDGEGADFEHVLGTTGGADRLLAIYNAERFELVATEELHQINIGGHVRAPLVLQLRIAGTDEEFLFVVNHLYRSRLAQTVGTNKPLSSTSGPICRHSRSFA